MIPAFHNSLVVRINQSNNHGTAELEHRMAEEWEEAEDCRLTGTDDLKMLQSAPVAALFPPIAQWALWSASDAQ